MTEGVDVAARLKHYEGKLATLTAINGVLQSENEKLREELEEARLPTTDAEEELAELQEEFAQRLGDADAQVAKYKDECQKLRAQLRLADQGGSASTAKLAEKDATLQKLRSEAEALSRRNGELETQVRKLRSSERDAGAERDRLAARVHALEAAAVQQSEARERAAAEAAQHLEALEGELEQQRRQHSRELASLQEELRRTSEQVEQERARGREEQLAGSMAREAALAESLQATRDTLAASQDAWDAQEAALQREISRLQDALHEAEALRDEQQYKGAEATQPLLKQIEAMAAQHAAKEQAQVALERSLTLRIKEQEEALGNAMDAERSAKRRASAAEAAATASKSAADAAMVTAAELQTKLDSEARKSAALQAEKECLRQQLVVAAQEAEEERGKAEMAQKDLKEQLWDAEQRARNLAAERDEAVRRVASYSDMNGETDWPAKSTEAAPTSSASADLHEAQQHAVAPEDDLDRMLKSVDSLAASQVAKSSSVGGAGAKASVDARIEILTAQLAEMQRQRDYHAEELCRAMERADAAEADAGASRALKEARDVLQNKLNICLEILGERNETIEQLQDDISDMRSIFHEQLNVAVDQMLAARQEVEALKAAGAEQDSAEADR